MEVFGVAVNVRSFIKVAMKQWNTKLTSCNQRLRNVKIKRRIFEGMSQIVLVMVPLTLLLKQVKPSYKVKKGGNEINDLLFTDDLKLFAKNEDQIDSPVNTVKAFSEDIKIEFELQFPLAFEFSLSDLEQES